MTVAFRFTTADLDRLPDIEGVRYEIIDGELYVSRAPTERHQRACAVLTGALDVWSDQSGLGWTVPTPGIVFTDDNNVIPDLVWISYERRHECVDEDGHYVLAPELVVEVLSPGVSNRLRDTDSKLALYGRQGVKEYWIVDWERENLEVYRTVGDNLCLVESLSNGSTLTSPLLPGFSCQTSRIWAAPLR